MMEKPLSQNEQKAVYRIIDANLNRSREALRVLEEYFRFIRNDKMLSGRVKEIRHGVSELASGLSQAELINGRDSESDPFSSGSTKSEMKRDSLFSIAQAGMKRAQEAFRVLEEYLKLTDCSDLSNLAKSLRFSLYTFEKQVIEKELNE